MRLYRECHDELKEGTSSLIFAASRCGEFPELQKIRQMLTSRFGKDFANCAIELRNKCRVNPTVKSWIFLSKSVIAEIFLLQYPSWDSLDRTKAFSKTTKLGNQIESPKGYCF